MSYVHDMFPDPPFRVWCADANNRPNEIPVSKWLTEEQWYTCIGFIKCNIQGGTIALILEELPLDGCEPYKGFDYRRFRLPQPTPVEQLEEELTT